MSHTKDRLTNCVIPLRDTRAGDYIRRKENSAIMLRQHYDASTKRISCSPVNDCNKEVWLKPDTLVHVGFTY